MSTLQTSAPRDRAAERRRRDLKRGRFFRLRLVTAILVSLVMVFPLYWMVLTAVSPQSDMYSAGIHLWPQHFTWENFREPLQTLPVWTWFRNSLLITTGVVVITVVCNLLAGYAFAKLPFRGRNAVFLIFLSTMMIPVQAIMVSQFKLSISLGLFGNVWAVILPESASAFGIFLARQFFIAFPDELIDAARVDGAGPLRTFLKIVLPLCKPLVAVLVVLTFMSEWNSFAWPLVALFGNDQLFTLPIGVVTDLQGQYSSDYGAIMAMSLLMTVPMVAIFLAFQRYFVQGLARSGIK